MAEYIDTSINPADYIEVWEVEDAEHGKQLVMAVDDLKCLPPADVRPVVLCGDCRYFTDTGYEGIDPDMPELRMGHCRILGRDVQACWFCGTGEWRERVLFRCPNCGSDNGGDAE